MKNIKFLVFSDLHAHTHKSFSTANKDGKNSIFELTIDILKQIRTYALEKEVYNIIFAGDLFDAKNHIPVIVFNEVYQELEKWSSSGLNVLMIPGNHDLAIRNGNVSGLDVISSLSGIRVVLKPEKLHWLLKNADNVQTYLNIVAIPFREKISEEFFISDFLDNEINIFVGHATVEGAFFKPDITTIESIFTKDDVVLFNKNNFLVGGDIKQKEIDKFDLSIVGHIHAPQIIGKKENILIPGQPWYQWPYEMGQQRGFWEIEFDDCKNCSKKLVELKIPKFIKVIIEEDTIFENNVKDNIILLLPKDNTIVEQTILNWKDYFQKKGAFYVDILPPISQAEVDSDNVVRLRFNPDYSPEDVLDKVLRSDFVSLGGFKLEELKFLGEDLIKTVKNLNNENCD